MLILKAKYNFSAIKEGLLVPSPKLIYEYNVHIHVCVSYHIIRRMVISHARPRLGKKRVGGGYFN